MSDCTHDCSSCGESCGERTAPQDFRAPANGLSHIGKVIAVVSGKGGVGKSLVTSSLAVAMRRMGKTVGVQQALGEFEEKFAQSRLTVVPAFPEEECSILADGRHLWRVIDNLLSNCNKYALEGTRIYVEVCRWEGKVVLSIKNISRQPLNIPAERLMERFVRGEESRTTEGSGLGLSIARSLTELQGGAFRLDIDGDLFKAVVSFPEAAGPELPANA